MSRRSKDLLAILLGTLGVNFLVAGYVRQEHTIYYWDLANYWQIFRHYLHMSDGGLRDVARELIGSTRYAEYNGIPVLPLLPVGQIFGNSRLVYILALTNCYAIPASMLGGWLAARSFPHYGSRRAFWTGVLCCLTASAFWYPQLRGMVAIGGLAVAWGILALYVQGLHRPLSFKTIFLLGVLICGLCLFRRFYIFWAVGFFLAAGCVSLFRRSSWEGKIFDLLRLGAVGLTASVLFALLAFPQIVYMLTADVEGTFNIYQAHQNPLRYLFAWINYTGWFTALLSLTGFVFAFREARLRPLATLLALQFVFILVIFGRVQVFEKHHFLMLFSLTLPMMVLPLLVAMRFRRRWIPAAVLGILAFGAAHAFIPAIGNALPGVSPILSGQRGYPLVREDFDAFSKMMHALCALPDAANEGEGVYVLASSEILNDEMVRAWYALTDLEKNQRAHIRFTANKDAARFGFPRELLHARYLLVASPVQLHLPVAHAQSAIEVPWQQVTAGVGWGAAFQPRPESFVLSHHVRVQVYERIMPLQARHVEALQKDFLQYYPETAEEYDFSLPQ